MKESKLSRLSAQLEKEAAEKQSRAADEAARDRKQKAHRQERVDDAHFLENSQVLEVLAEAAFLLKKSGHGPSLSITNPNFSSRLGGSEDPIDLKLVWDVKGREDSHPLVGSDDHHGTVYSWKEANCRLIKDGEGKIRGLKFNVSPELDHTSFFESNLSLLDIIFSAVDRAVTHPLLLDEERDGRSFPLGYARSENGPRIILPSS